MSEAKPFSLQVIESHIIRMTVVEGIELEQKHALELIAEATRLANNKEYCILFEANVSGNITHEAREEFAKSKKRIACAMVTNSLANKLLGNFFIKFHKPKTPARIFSDEKTALEWLRAVIAEKLVKPEMLID